MLIDPIYNAQYSEIHQHSNYGVSGFLLLPEVALYVLDAITTGRISQKSPIKILDYGCGRSCLMDILEYVMEPLWTQTIRPLNTAQLYPFIQLRIDDLIEKRKAGKLDIHAQNNHILPFRYDPAIEDYSTLPEGPFDFVLCTDVMEHIPDAPNADWDGKSVLDSVIEKLGALSQNHYINISTRLAEQILPNGQNAHCTVMPSAAWQNKLEKYLKRPVIEVDCRDPTACNFVTFQPSFDAEVAARGLISRYGGI